MVSEAPRQHKEYRLDWLAWALSSRTAALRDCRRSPAPRAKRNNSRHGEECRRDEFYVIFRGLALPSGCPLDLLMEKRPKELDVVVAHPSDVLPERNCVPGVLNDVNRFSEEFLNLRLKMRSWETDAYPGIHSEGPQGLIDSVLHIEDCEILIGIFWK